MTEDSESELPFIIAAGASAGGLEALMALLEACPEHSGLAIIVVQHLSPDYESLMPELLARHVDMRVVHAQDETVPEPDTVYVIQPQTVLTFREGRIRVEPLHKEPGRLSLPINSLFESLAAERKDNCALVVLSGTGSDGAAGIRAGKQLGAVTVAQSPDTARFDGMPRAAAATGFVDLVLGPRDVVPQIMEMLQEGKTAYFARGSARMELVLPRVLAAVRNHTGIDFSHYKPGTIIRRVQRRMRQLEVEDVREYADRLREDADEARHLRGELLIGVTRFLRDEGAIEAVRQIAIPRLLVAGHGPLRLWVPGCSTGEEAYSLAMMVQEGLDSMGQSRTFKLFATDVDEFAIEQASLGEYSLEAAEQLPPSLRERYFVRRGDLYVVTKALREKLLFSRHDLLQDPPFSRIDMVSCRNLLIYFKAQAQERALRLLSNSMRDQGILWLGASESVGDRADMFEVLDGRWKIFLARANRKRTPIAPLRSRPGGIGDGSRARQPDRVRLILEQVQADYVPPCLVVDENLRLLYRFGDLDRLVRLPQGVVSLDVRDFLPEELSGLLSTVAGRVRESGEALYREVHSDLPGGPVRFDLRVRQVRLEGTSYMLALFFEALKEREEDPVEVDSHDVEADTRDRISTLERELRLSRENLQATIEELESSNEELQATNEELVAANEELQSTNEELQSVNEELHTVNAEHAEKLEELGQLNDDLDNLFSSVDIAILFLDAKLAIRRFNSAVERYFNVLQHDEGRPLAHLSHRLEYRELLDDCARVLRSGEPIHRRVRSAAEVVMVRLTPHVSQVYGVQGVVISLTDITSVEDTRRRIEQLTAAFRDSPVSICMLEPDGEILHVNPAFEARSGYDEEGLSGTSWLRILPESERDRGREVLSMVREGRAWRGVLRMWTKESGEYFELVRMSRSSQSGHSLVHIGELLSARFVPYERARAKDEPAAIGRPSYSLWSADPRLQVIDDGLSELLGVPGGNGLSLATPEEFADEADVAALKELFASADGVNASMGYRFHTRTSDDRRRLLARFGSLGDPIGGGTARALLEVAELPPGPSGWRA